MLSRCGVCVEIGLGCGEGMGEVCGGEVDGELCWEVVWSFLRGDQGIQHSVHRGDIGVVQHRYTMINCGLQHSPAGQRLDMGVGVVVIVNFDLVRRWVQVVDNFLSYFCWAQVVIPDRHNNRPLIVIVNVVNTFIHTLNVFLGVGVCDVNIDDKKLLLLLRETHALCCCI